MGYVGKRMSERALEAYEGGEKPLSKWTKEEILDTLSYHGFERNILKKYSKKVLSRVFLEKTSWHHTGAYYRKTDFYSIDYYALENKEESLEKCEEVKAFLEDCKAKEKALQEEKKKEVKKPPYQKVRFHYLEWEGSKRHPYAVDCESIGYLKDDIIYYRPIYSLKKKFLSSNGTYIVERFDEFYTKEEVENNR